MCGISGIISHKNHMEYIVQDMNNRIAHRGPDGEGIWYGEGIALGHRRLSILDLSETGNQPMSYLNERYWIVYNGEIYNFLEIREQLKSKGYRFCSDSDTEVVLAAYIEWGSNCLEKFNGMWAFAIWDCQRKELFLSRDRFGIKPLYYHHKNGIFAFSSEMKGLFPILDEIKTNYSVVEKAKQSVFLYESTEECLIEGIKRFPAGSYAIFSDNHLTIKKWWETLDNIPEIPQRYEQQVEQFRELFLDSCRIRMRSDVPIGTCLSGGLDSSAVVCSMNNISSKYKGNRQSDDWQHAFVATFPGSPIDERKYAEKVVNFTGVNAEYLDIKPVDVVGQLNNMLYLFEEIYLTSPIPFMQTYMKVRQNGIGVTLDGHGADELFGGYPSSSIIAVQDAGFDLKRVFDLYNIHKNCFGDMNTQVTNSSILKQFISSSIKGRIKKILKWHTLPFADHERWNDLDKLSQQLYYETHNSILPTLLRNYDRYSMANGVEIRMPFMDWRVVTFAFALPDSAKVGGGFTKRIIRDAMSPYMPPEIAYRKSKIGFNSPVVEWFQGPLKPWLLDILNSNDFLQSSIVDGKRLSKEGQAIINSTNMQWAQGEKLWTDITPYLWERAMVRTKH